MIDSLVAGKTLCEISSWTITNLRLQKVLYFAHMFYSGREKKKLIGENFQAWEYGPVLPSLYRHVKQFGKYPIESSVFFFQKGLESRDKEFTYLENMYNAMDDLDAGDMINISHWKEGAWYKAYEPGERGRIISQEDIVIEYHARFGESG
ncbi:MAG: DUF4065 domain-containing protein [Hyphomicrobiales bacterium]|nr:DUF4065 domain-containing protein [Hyphomicrobiales bacterium]MCY4053459.1 DUF4065 domain-containing protein [Hyphomicrobiales bacterium]